MDITEQKPKEQKLRNRPEVLLGIIESAMEAIIAIDESRRIVLFNAAAEKIFECPAAEAMGGSVDRFIPQRYRVRYSEKIATIAESGIAARASGSLGRLWGLRPTGEEFPIEVSITQIETDGEKLYAMAIRDDSQRRGAEVAVRESEQRFQLIADHAPVLIWMSGTDKLCTYFNQPWLKFTGRTLEAELGNGWAEGVHPEDLQRCLETYEQSFDRRERFRMEYRLRRFDGEYRWILDVGAPRFNQDGSFAGYIGVGIDVTYRKLIENERKAAEERLREYEKAVEGLEEMIAVVDRDYRFLLANRKFLTMRGMTREQVVGHTMSEVLNKDMWEAVIREKVEEAFTGKVVKYEMSYKYPEVGNRDVSVSYFPMDGVTGVDRVALIVRDITEEKRAEEVLRESEEKFRSVFQDAGIGMVIVSTEGRFLYVNDTFCGYLGYTQKELTGMSVQAITVPEDWGQFSERLREALDKGMNFRNIEKRCLHKSGRVVYTNSSGIVIRGPNGEPRYFVGEAIDVTERKRAEEALAGMSRKLVEAQERERARLARELHDDIGQRLALLTIELEQLEQDPPRLSSEVRRIVHGLRTQALDLSTDLQTLSHELHSSKLEYLGIVAAMKGWCDEFARRQKMEVKFNSHDVPGALPSEIALSLFRVLQEAMNNAAKHSKARRIEVQLRGTPRDIDLTVTDLGKGFDVPSATKGQGLGLTSMRERVRLVSGTIAIESKPKSGTTVHVRVPYHLRSISERAAG